MKSILFGYLLERIERLEAIVQQLMEPEELPEERPEEPDDLSRETP